MKIPEGLKLVALDDGGVTGCYADQSDWERRHQWGNAVHLWAPTAQEFVHAITAARTRGPKMVIAYVKDSVQLAPKSVDQRRTS